MTERRKRVIIITKGNIGCNKNFEGELRAYLNTSIHLKWDEHPKKPENARRKFINTLRCEIGHPPKSDPKKVENVDV